MKKITLLTALIIMTAVGVQAQFPGGNAKGQKPPDMGHIYGKITDSTGAAINGASVLLLQSRLDTVTKKRKDVLLKGITTKSNGEFSFTDLPMFGQMKLKISATGYKPVEQTVSFQIKMNPGSAPRPNGGDPSQAMAAISSMAGAFD